MNNPHTPDILTLVSREPRQHSYAEVAKEFNMTAEAVRKIARHNNVTSFFRGTRSSGRDGIIGSSTLQNQESKMREATQAEQSRIERLLKKNGYRPHWAVSWVHLQDEGIKTTTLLKNPQAEQVEQNAQEAFLARIKQAAPRIRKQPIPSKNLAVFGSFDAHIGKHCELIRTGNDYTPEKAVSQLLEGQAALYQMTKPHGVTDILLPMGNDIVHVDNNSHTSTSGTPQDAYGSVESMMYLAVEFYIKTITEWAKTHNVWLCHVHSNHDRTAGWSVSQMVARYFHNHPRVHTAFENLDQRHRKYFIFGNSLLMFHHGEAKEERLLGVIKAEATEAFWQTDHIYCYQGHVHHSVVNKRGLNTEQVKKDHSALTVIKAGSGVRNQMHVQTLRSPSPADDWHSRNLFCNMPSIEVFLHNERYQFGNFTYEM